MARDDFSEDVKRRLKDRVSAHCSNPSCNVITTAASDESVSAVNNIGVAAHICAAASGKGARRYKESMTSDERSSIENGIWLCASCSVLIDRDEVTYPEELLRGWKEQAEKTAQSRLGKRIASESGLSEKLVDRLLKNLDEKDIALQDRDKVISEWTEKYKELEKRLDSRNDDISNKAKEFLENGQLEKAEDLYKESLEKNLKMAQQANLQAANDAFSLALIKDLEWNTQAAIEYYLQGLQLNPYNADGWNNLGIKLQLIGELDESINAYQIVLRLGQEHKSQKEIAMAYGNLGNVYRTQGDLDKAVEYYKKSLEITESLGDEEKMAASYGNLGIVYKTRGDLNRAVEYYNKALKIAEGLDDKEKMAAAYANLGGVYLMCSNFDKVIEYYNKALKIAEGLGDKEKMAAAYSNLGSVYLMCGDLDKAVEYYNKALEIDESLGRKEGIAVLYGNLGIVSDTRGDLDMAVEYYNKALRINENVGDKEKMAASYVNLGLLYETRKDYKKACEYGEKSLALFQALGSPNARMVQGWLDDLPQEK